VTLERAMEKLADANERNAKLQRTLSVMERALWMALDGKEVVVREDTPADILWAELPDGGQLVRRVKIVSNRGARCETRERTTPDDRMASRAHKSGMGGACG